MKKLIKEIWSAILSGYRPEPKFLIAEHGSLVLSEASLKILKDYNIKIISYHKGSARPRLLRSCE